jgi:hypothetical protein
MKNLQTFGRLKKASIILAGVVAIIACACNLAYAQGPGWWNRPYRSPEPSQGPSFCVWDGKKYKEGEIVSGKPGAILDGTFQCKDGEWVQLKKK